MKKVYFTFAIILIAIRLQCQYLPLHYSPGNNSVYYTTSYFWAERNFVYDHDSILYIITNGAVVMLNTNTGQSQFRLHNFYKTQLMCADTGANITLLKANNTLSVYNFLADSMRDITPPLSGGYINNIGRSDSQTWILADTNVLGRYNGQQWFFDTAAFNIGFMLLVQNDSTAYVMNGTKIVRWRNGIFTTIAALPLGGYYSSWDIDSRGIIWVASNTNLIRVDTTGHLNTFVDTITPLHSAFFYNVMADDSGNIWCQADNNVLYKFNEHTWVMDTLLAQADEASINRKTGKIYGYMSYYNQAFTLLNGNQNYYTPSYQIFRNIRAGNSRFTATDEGIFPQNYNNTPSFQGFNDTTPYATDVTCFAKLQLISSPNYYYYNYNYNLNSDSLYGTHHGIYSFNGVPFYNYLLHDSNINCIRFFNDAYYVGTDKGCCIINGGQATYYDTTNAPLPSNKVTAICAALYENYQTLHTDTFLWIGTDRGVAMKGPHGWQVFDTAHLHLNSCYVSDIAFPAQVFDTLIWVTTLGQGLLELDTNGSYQILNTTNGLFEDDSIFYINSFYYDYYCVYASALGTSEHGIAYEIYGGQFMYDTLLDGYLFHQSRIAGDPWLTADSGYAVVEVCEAIPVVQAAAKKLKWHQEGNQLEIFMPERYSGNAIFSLYDLEGRNVSGLTINAVDGTPVTMPAEKLASGLYIMQCKIKGETLYTKLVYTR